MELEHFIEQDIKEFLERKRREQSTRPSTPSPSTGVLSPEELAIYTPERDFAKELEQALHDLDFYKGQRTLEELKRSFQEYPKDSPEYIERQRLFNSLYATYQRMVDENKGSGQPPPAVEEPSIEQPLHELPRAPPEPAAMEDPQPIADLLDSVEQHITNEAMVSAIATYQDARAKFNTAHLSHEDHAKLAGRFRTIYDHLHDQLHTMLLGAIQEPPPIEVAERQLMGAP